MPFLVDSMVWLHLLVHTDQMVKRSTHHKTDLGQWEIVVKLVSNLCQFPGNGVCGYMAQLFAKVLQMPMFWLVWPEIDDPPVCSDQTWPQQKVKNIKLGIRPAFRH